MTRSMRWMDSFMKLLFAPDASSSSNGQPLSGKKKKRRRGRHRDSTDSSGPRTVQYADSFIFVPNDDDDEPRTRANTDTSGVISRRALSQHSPLPTSPSPPPPLYQRLESVSNNTVLHRPSSCHSLRNDQPISKGNKLFYSQEDLLSLNDSSGCIIH